MKKYKINPKLTYKSLSERVIILDENKAEVRELNEVASLIFLNMIDWITLKEVAKKITAIYDIDENRVLRDIKKFVSMYEDNYYLIVKE